MHYFFGERKIFQVQKEGGGGKGGEDGGFSHLKTNIMIVRHEPKQKKISHCYWKNIKNGME